MSVTKTEIYLKNGILKKIEKSAKEKDNYYKVIAKEAYDFLLKKVDDEKSAPKKTSAH